LFSTGIFSVALSLVGPSGAIFGKCCIIGYFGMTVRNQNSIQEEIKRRQSLSNACYHLVQNLSSRLLAINVKTGLFVSVRFETWSLTLRDEHRLRISLPLFFSVFCAAYFFLNTFSVVNTLSLFKL
jgi:hypothetical protein